MKFVEILVKGEREAFSGTPGFEKFVQFNRMGTVALLGQPFHGFRASGRQHHMPINTHRITGKPFAL